MKRHQIVFNQIGLCCATESQVQRACEPRDAIVTPTAHAHPKWCRCARCSERGAPQT